MTHPLIDVNDIGFSYGDNPVLEHVSFTVNRGDYVGIVGPNGAGKSTLLKIMVGLIEPETGHVAIEGTPIHQMKDRYKIGYVPQRAGEGNITFPATVFEVIESGLIATKKNVGRLSHDDRRAIQRAIAVAGIEPLTNTLISALSGGQRQRVFVARALACDPKILILDEPFMGIDLRAQEDFFAFLKRLNERDGLTILFVSHEIDVMTKEVKSIICLNKGLLCMGPPSLLQEPHVMEKIYGKNTTQLHHAGHHHSH